MFKLSYVELVTGIKAAKLKELIGQGILTAEDRDGVTYISPASIESYLTAEGRFVPDVFRTNSIRVLIVDDEQNMLNSLKRLFQRFPRMTVNIASNAFEMGHSLKAIVPDIIILDYSMPGINGLEVLNNLNEEGCLDKIHVIVYTARLPEELEPALTEFKNVQVLAKSADFKELLLTLEKMLNKTREPI
ncbi:response regulator [Seleniivibrio sp.]|uniref:response regulator n=1 Tax=Seleniivibrio sp. TaxID=2898801 RepID=UPI0025EF4F27|nr:response regulator [Seleniivibrio sp.]MCD8554948.1 response regulator [Seleniivibrio sp.]